MWVIDKRLFICSVLQWLHLCVYSSGSRRRLGKQIIILFINKNNEIGDRGDSTFGLNMYGF